jgi:hypothetical protein
VRTAVEALECPGELLERPQSQRSRIFERPPVVADDGGERLGGGIVVVLGQLVKGGARLRPFQKEHTVDGVLLDDVDRYGTGEAETEQLAFGALYLWNASRLDLEHACTAVGPLDGRNVAVGEGELSNDRQLPAFEVTGDKIRKLIEPGPPGTGQPLPISRGEVELVHGRHHPKNTVLRGCIETATRMGFVHSAGGAAGRLQIRIPLRELLHDDPRLRASGLRQWSQRTASLRRRRRRAW